MDERRLSRAARARADRESVERVTEVVLSPAQPEPTGRLQEAREPSSGESPERSLDEGGTTLELETRGAAAHSRAQPENSADEEDNTDDSEREVVESSTEDREASGEEFEGSDLEVAEEMEFEADSALEPIEEPSMESARRRSTDSGATEADRSSASRADFLRSGETANSLGVQSADAARTAVSMANPGEGVPSPPLAGSKTGAVPTGAAPAAGDATSNPVTKALQRTAEPTPAIRSDNVERFRALLDQSFRARTLQDRWQVELELKPQDLGVIRIQFELRGETLVGRMQFADRGLEPQMQSLLADLEDELEDWHGAQAFLEYDEGSHHPSPESAEGRGRDLSTTDPRRSEPERRSAENSLYQIDLVA